MSALESQEGLAGGGHKLMPSLLATLPTELIERILDFAILDNGNMSTTASLDASLRFHEACKIGLVCRQFQLIARPMMYKHVSVSIRQMSSFLSTLERSPEIARCIKDLTFEGRIWTDIDQEVVERILLAVRQTCVRVRLGANESLLLPYLLHGRPASMQDRDGATESDCALQALNITWRDEVQVKGQWEHLHRDEQTHEPSTDTLYHLFQHKCDARYVSNSPPPPPPPPPLGHQPLPSLTHLTLDLYSQTQLNQLFDSNGYFVKTILPKLLFLRIEMPLVVLQFTCAKAGDLVRGWPKDDWLLSSTSAADVVQEAIDIRQDQTRQVIAHHNDNGRFLEQDETGSGGSAGGRTTEDDLIMPYCPANQLKSLTLRFLLNVHRNDMMLFRLTCPTKALEQSWSTRASVAAHCLSSTMQMYLNSSNDDDDGGKANEGGDRRHSRVPRICSFPFAQYKSKGAEVYWKQKWMQAEADCNASLPAEIRPPIPPSNHHSQMADIPSDSTKVSLLLKWPNAVDAFFHYSAMI